LWQMSVSHVGHCSWTMLGMVGSSVPKGCSHYVAYGRGWESIFKSN
jgi:hypothetical protein